MNNVGRMSWWLLCFAGLGCGGGIGNDTNVAPIGNEAAVDGGGSSERPRGSGGMPAASEMVSPDLGLVIARAGDSDSGKTTAAADGGVSGSTLDAGSIPDSGPAPDPSEFVFDDRKLSTWRIVFTDADLKKLDATAVREAYVPATLMVDGEDVGRVGVRYKGAGSTLADCFATGVNSCKKLSYKIGFNEFDPPKRFHSLKKINLHAHRYDVSHLNERLSYKMFRQQRVAAPRSVTAKVFVNGQYKGVFGLTENIDGRFTDRSWPGAGDGNLYKEAWPLSSNPKFYVDHQKTNEPDPGDPAKRVVPPTKILAFQKQLYGASAADLPKVVDSWMNLDYMFRVLAVDLAIGNWDGPLIFYCQNGPTQPCTNHNFYIYEAERENRLWLVPWDMDSTFQFSLRGEKAILTPWDQPPADCTRRFEAFPGVFVMHPGCDRIYRAMILAGRERFVAAVNDLLAGAFNTDLMRADIDRWAAQMSDAVRADPNGLPFAAWQGEVASIRARIAPLREKLIALRDRKTPPP